MNDVVNRALRDHVRYTGDGLPNEPTGAPLPVGDPASGVFVPQKADLREAMTETIEVSGAARDATLAAAAFRRATLAALLATPASEVPEGARVEVPGVGVYERAPDGTPVVNGYPLQGAGAVRWFVIPENGAMSFAAWGPVSGADVSAQLQSMLNQKRSMNLPDGDFRIDSTVVWPTLPVFAGGWMRGVGSTISDRGVSRATSAITRFSWGGAAGGTMWDITGHAAMTLEHIAFSGISGTGATNNAGVGIHFKRSPSAGAGYFRIDDWSFDDFTLAMRMGVLVEDDNCAGFSFDRLVANDCGTVIEVENDQALHFIFNYPAINRTATFLRFDRGGNVLINAANFAACGGSDWVFDFKALAPNIYANELSGCRFEQGSSQFVRTVGGSIEINHLTEAQTNQNARLFEFRGTNATIRDSLLVTNSPTTPTIFLSRQLGGYAGKLVLENVHFSGVTSFVIGNWIERENTNTPSVLVMRGCTFGANATPIKDFATDLAFGDVIMQGTTVNTGSASLTQFGLTRSFNSVCGLKTNFTQTVDVFIVGRNTSNAVAYSTQIRAVTKNVAGTSTLETSQVIGTPYNPLSLGTAPTVSVSDSFDCLDVNVTGRTGETITWTATLREANAVAMA